MYKLVNENVKIGHKGKSYGKDNVNSLPKDLLLRLEKANIVKEIEVEPKQKSNGKKNN